MVGPLLQSGANPILPVHLAAGGGANPLGMDSNSIFFPKFQEFSMDPKMSMQILHWQGKPATTSLSINAPKPLSWGYQPIILANFPQKLHENRKKNWTERDA